MSPGLHILINSISSIDPQIDATNVTSITQAINVLENLYGIDPIKFVDNFDGIIDILRAMLNGAI